MKKTNKQPKTDAQKLEGYTRMVKSRIACGIAGIVALVLGWFVLGFFLMFAGEWGYSYVDNPGEEYYALIEEDLETTLPDDLNIVKITTRVEGQSSLDEKATLISNYSKQQWMDLFGQDIFERSAFWNCEEFTDEYGLLQGSKLMIGRDSLHEMSEFVRENGEKVSYDETANICFISFVSIVILFIVFPFGTIMKLKYKIKVRKNERICNESEQD